MNLPLAEIAGSIHVGLAGLGVTGIVVPEAAGHLQQRWVNLAWFRYILLIGKVSLQSPQTGTVAFTFLSISEGSISR